MTSSSRHGTTAISVSGIRFSYGARTILDDVSLTVNYGEVVGLLGPNGTGKSTLVGIMAGDLEPQSGSVAYHGKDLTDFARRELAQTRSVMPQTIEFPFSYMVHDIVAMGRQCWDPDPDKDHKIVAQSLIRTDVGGFETRDVTRLSGGEKARVTLARVLAQEASVVFLDEPTAALDIAHQERTMKICRELAAAGHAVIAVMHDLQLAAAHCDRIALMSSGSIAAYDVPDVVLNSELLSRVYDWPITVARVADGRLVILPE